MSLYLAAKGEVPDKTPFRNEHFPKINQNQQDVDLLIAFEGDGTGEATTHMVLIEAKAYLGWNKRSVERKGRKATGNLRRARNMLARRDAVLCAHDGKAFQADPHTVVAEMDDETRPTDVAGLRPAAPAQDHALHGERELLQERRTLAPGLGAARRFMTALGSEDRRRVTRAGTSSPRRESRTRLALERAPRDDDPRSRNRVDRGDSGETGRSEQRTDAGARTREVLKLEARVDRGEIVPAPDDRRRRLVRLRRALRKPGARGDPDRNRNAVGERTSDRRLHPVDDGLRIVSCREPADNSSIECTTATGRTAPTAETMRSWTWT